jgi:hypothetical protein
MNDSRYQAARKHVREIKGFYTHLAVFVIINVFLFVMDLLTGPGWWFQWVVWSWGIGLAIHAYITFVGHRLFGPDWEEHKIAELLGEKPKRGRILSDDADEIPADYDHEPPLADVETEARHRSGSC